MRCDVSIVGGGPAGSALALRLACLGHSVAVSERSDFDRPRAGESLHRGAFAMFEALGIGDVPCVRVSRSLVRWSGDTDVVEHEGLAVGRPQLDRFLLDRARDAGARVFQPQAVGQAPDAQFVVDASGRASWSRAPRRRTGVPTTAIAAHFPHRGLTPRVEALEDGWLWGSPIPDGRFSVMAFVDAGTDTGAARLEAMLRSSALFGELGERSVLRRYDATTYACDAPWDAPVLRVGEASFSLDPLSSSGVHAALQSAIHASIALHTMLLHPERASLATCFYADAQAAAVRQHSVWTAAFYGQSRFADAPFYTKRIGPLFVPDPAGAGLPARNSWDGPVARGTETLQLSPDVTITDVPCIVGDLVESRPGLVRAGLPRPFVWLGGREIAPLLAPFSRGPCRAEELASSWSEIPPRDRESVLEALVRNRIVVPGP